MPCCCSLGKPLLHIYNSMMDCHYNQEAGAGGEGASKYTSLLYAGENRLTLRCLGKLWLVGKVRAL